MNVLVTGAGSLIGHGILRCLRRIEGRDFKIITCDPDHRATGHWLGDLAVKIPLAKSSGYLDRLKEIIADNEVDIVFVGTDPELEKISEAVHGLSGTIVVSSPATISVANDKWETVQFLKTNGFYFPETARLEKPEEVFNLIQKIGFPLIAKPRVGARSSGVFKVSSLADIEQFTGRSDYLLQEFLPDLPGEYTAGTMTFNRECFSCVSFRRDLKDGNTYRAYLHQSLDEYDYLERVSKALPGVFGPINFQYRLRDGLPVIFEINSRFSGTTPLRLAAGINEVEMVLDYVKKGGLERKKLHNKPIAILRTWSDIIVNQSEIDSFEHDGILATPKASYFPFLEK